MVLYRIERVKIISKESSRSMWIRVLEKPDDVESIAMAF